MLTDEEIVKRLNELGVHPPCDQWAHVVRQLRKGRIYFVKERTGPGWDNRDQMCFVEEGAPRIGKPKKNFKKLKGL